MCWCPTSVEGLLTLQMFSSCSQIIGAEASSCRQELIELLDTGLAIRVWIVTGWQIDVWAPGPLRLVTAAYMLSDELVLTDGSNCLGWPRLWFSPYMLLSCWRTYTVLNKGLVNKHGHAHNTQKDFSPHCLCWSMGSLHVQTLQGLIHNEH